MWEKVVVFLAQTAVCKPAEMLLERSALVGCVSETGLFSGIQATGVHSHCLAQKASPLKAYGGEDPWRGP